jgi:hypothetical protein
MGDYGSLFLSHASGDAPSGDGVIGQGNIDFGKLQNSGKINPTLPSSGSYTPRSTRSRHSQGGNLMLHSLLNNNPGASPQPSMPSSRYRSATGSAAGSVAGSGRSSNMHSGANTPRGRGNDFNLGYFSGNSTPRNGGGFSGAQTPSHRRNASNVPGTPGNFGNSANSGIRSGFATGAQTPRPSSSLHTPRVGPLTPMNGSMTPARTLPPSGSLGGSGSGGGMPMTPLNMTPARLGASSSGGGVPQTPSRGAYLHPHGSMTPAAGRPGSGSAPPLPHTPVGYGLHTPGRMGIQGARTPGGPRTPSGAPRPGGHMQMPAGRPPYSTMKSSDRPTGSDILDDL